ncbi:MAG: GDSL-type esterase/lipase family protein [Bacteroidota bacterium]
MIVLSIRLGRYPLAASHLPDEQGRDKRQIEKEIDAYNAANRQIALSYGAEYINITSWTREAAADLSLLTTDGLHPSAKEYKRWAEKIAAWIAL